MDILDIVKILGEDLPHFSDGRIDYTTSVIAPVVNVVVCFSGEILLLKRSQKVLAYKGMWNSLGGYMDEVKPVEEKMYEELQEELGVLKKQVARIILGKSRKQVDRKIGRTWVIQPGLAVLHERPEIVLDFEHTEFVWTKPEDVSKYNIISGIDQLVASFNEEIQKTL